MRILPPPQCDQSDRQQKAVQHERLKRQSDDRKKAVVLVPADGDGNARENKIADKHGDLYEEQSNDARTTWSEPRRGYEGDQQPNGSIIERCHRACLPSLYVRGGRRPPYGYLLGSY